MTHGEIALALLAAFAAGLATGGNAWWRLGLRAGAHGALWAACKRGWIGCGDWPRIDDLVRQVCNEKMTGAQRLEGPP